MPIVVSPDATTLPASREDMREALQHELRGKSHDLTNNRGVVQFLNTAVNAFLAEDLLSRQELNTLAYVCGVQLKGIAAEKAEERPGDSLSTLLGAGAHVEITMTREERRMLLTAGSPDKMAMVLKQVRDDGRIIEVEQQSDGSYSIPVMEQPPRMDAQMPTALLAAACDIPKDAARALFGSSLGGDGKETEIEEFGFDDMFDPTAKQAAELGHTWTTVSIDHLDLPGVVRRLSKCTKCAITTSNTRTYDDNYCTGGLNEKGEGAEIQRLSDISVAAEPAGASMDNEAE